MTKVILNGQTIEVVAVNGARKTVQGATRETLTFKLNPDTIDLNTAQELFKNQPSIIIECPNNETGEADRFVYNDYTIMFEVSLKQELVSPETSESEAVYASYINIGLAQMTYLEKLTAQNTQNIQTTNEAIIGLMDIINFM